MFSDISMLKEFSLDYHRQPAPSHCSRAASQYQHVALITAAARFFAQLTKPDHFSQTNRREKLFIAHQLTAELTKQK